MVVVGWLVVVAVVVMVVVVVVIVKLMRVRCAGGECSRCCPWRRALK